MTRKKITDLTEDTSPQLADYSVSHDGTTAKKVTWQKIKDLFGAAAGGAWGSITGTLSAQTDLQTALDAKQNTLVSAGNIKTINGSSVLGSGDLTVGGTLPAGTVVQVKTAVAGPTVQTINSVTPVAITGLSITITPQSASNLIVIFATFPFIHDYQTISSFGVFKDGAATVSTSGNGNENNMQLTFYATPLQNYDSIQGHLMHSELAGTTSATTYTIRATNGWAGTPGNLYINGRPNADMSGFSYFTIFEIKQ